MEDGYAGPLRDAPLAIELHNTRYAVAGSPVDGLADAGQARAWVAAVGARIGDAPGGPPPEIGRLVALREAVRELLQAAIDGTAPEPAALVAVNEASAAAPRSSEAVVRESGAVEQRANHHGATFADAFLAAIARDAIELVTGPRRAELRACGAPGCVLLFVRDGSRRAWCCSACGNRARQARHYRRARIG
jgi:predicted RNA-binding Zn ribbon-like protein